MIHLALCLGLAVHAAGEPVDAAANAERLKRCAEREERARRLPPAEAAADRAMFSAICSTAASSGAPAKGGPGAQSPLPEQGRIVARAEGIAAALGQGRSVAASGPAAVAAPGVRAGPLLSETKTQRRTTVPPPPAPLSSSEVDRRWSQELRAQIARYPSGQALLRRFPESLPVTFEKKEPHVGAEYGIGLFNSPGIVFNTVAVSEGIDFLVPGAAKAADLTQPAALRRYLASRPDILMRLIPLFDDMYVHELAHAAQAPYEPLFYLTTPIEHEWEAVETQCLYFHEKVLADPSLLRGGGPTLEFSLEPYLGYIGDLAALRRAKAATYQTTTLTLAELARPREEKEYFAAVLAREESEWPRRSVQGLILLARGHNGARTPDKAFSSLKRAYERAERYRFLEDVRAELSEVLRTTLAGLEGSADEAAARQFARRYLKDVRAGPKAAPRSK